MADNEVKSVDFDALEHAHKRFVTTYPETKAWKIWLGRGLRIEVARDGEHYDPPFGVTRVLDMEDSFFKALEQHWVKVAKS